MQRQSTLARGSVYRSATLNGHIRVNQNSRTRVVLRKVQTTDVDTQTTPTTVRQADDDVSSSQEEDWVWRKSQTKITVFSGAQYVESYLGPPLQKAGFQNVDFVEARLDRHTAPLAEGSPVVCLFVNDDCDKKAVKKLAQCGVKMIAMRCAGYERVDLAACAEHGIKVARVPTYSPTSVAEHAVALLFALNRHLNIAYTRVMAGNYSLGPLVGMELRGKKVGIIGTGAIGTEAARIFKGIGMDVMAYDVRHNPAVEAMGIPYVSVEEMLPQCDVISLHVPMLPSTYHIINRPRISMMKQGCILLNVSRGGLVDSDEIMHGLESGQIGALGMDVWENEANIFFEDWTDMDLMTRMKNWDRKFKVLTSYPNVIVTPHSAFLTNEALDNIASTTISNIEEFLLGKPLTNELKAN